MAQMLMDKAFRMTNLLHNPRSIIHTLYLFYHIFAPPTLYFWE